ncbi:MAG: hypothetical protein FWH48_06285 [Oscillospiraceae bacterium]|nr:hypothetical protein [Oscillospiraceae bacterium]
MISTKPMKFEYNLGTVLKFQDWAENLPDDADFVDYWYNLFLSQTKEKIEESMLNNINAFWWNRWRNDFETYVDAYVPISGNGQTPDIRNWFAQYMQYLVYALQLPSKKIAEFYGKGAFEAVAKMYPKHHCYGADYFVNSFIGEFGLPPEVASVTPVGL